MDSIEIIDDALSQINLPSVFKLQLNGNINAADEKLKSYTNDNIQLTAAVLQYGQNFIIYPSYIIIGPSIFKFPINRRFKQIKRDEFMLIQLKNYNILINKNVAIIKKLDNNNEVSI